MKIATNLLEALIPTNSNNSNTEQGSMFPMLFAKFTTTSSTISDESEDTTYILDPQLMVGIMGKINNILELVEDQIPQNELAAILATGNEAKIDIQQLLLALEKFQTQAQSLSGNIDAIADNKDSTELLQTIANLTEEIKEMVDLTKIKDEGKVLETAFLTKKSTNLSMVGKLEVKSVAQNSINQGLSLFYGKNSKGSTPLNLDTVVVVEPKEVAEVDGDLNDNINLANSLKTEVMSKPQFVMEVDLQSHETNINNLTEKIKEMLVPQSFKVLQMGDITTSTLRLYPKELGEVNVQLELIKGQLSIKIMATNENAYNYLNNNAKDLVQNINNNNSFSEVTVDFYMGDTAEGGKQDSQFEQFLKGTKRVVKEEVVEEQDVIEIKTSNYNYKI